MHSRALNRTWRGVSVWIIIMKTRSSMIKPQIKWKRTSTVKPEITYIKPIYKHAIQVTLYSGPSCATRFASSGPLYRSCLRKLRPLSGQKHHRFFRHSCSCCSCRSCWCRCDRNCRRVFVHVRAVFFLRLNGMLLLHLDLRSAMDTCYIGCVGTPI